MKNFKVDEGGERGFKTTDLNIAALLLCSEGSTGEFSLNGDGSEKTFFIKGDPAKLEDIKNKFFRGKPVIGDIRAFTEKRKSLLKLLPR